MKFKILLEIFLSLEVLTFLNKMNNILMSDAISWLFSKILHTEEGENIGMGV